MFCLSEFRAREFAMSANTLKAGIDRQLLDGRF
jgi:hypothetical protein